ncbi:MAG: hypothetical protein GY821_00950, partial [Gammaproteobacteria bacterium]|nr:hypothetical protein [Gammaproteobacteria bacterium]
MEVIVQDDEGLTSSQLIAVTVDDVNEAPFITSSATANADENQTAVRTVTANDLDAGDT